MQRRMHIHEYQTTIVCIDSYDNGILDGRFYNPNHSSGESFQCLGQFLIKLDQELDEMNLPQAFTKPRAFSSPPILKDDGPPERKVQEGKLATFSVRILFRQNSSWQGTVSWLETNVEQPFRSALELILLMDGALRKAQAADAPLPAEA